MNLPRVMKCAGASRCVLTCSVIVISWPPARSNARCLIHRMAGPGEPAEAGVWSEKSCVRSRNLNRQTMPQLSDVDLAQTVRVEGESRQPHDRGPRVPEPARPDDPLTLRLECLL